MTSPHFVSTGAGCRATSLPAAPRPAAKDRPRSSTFTRPMEWLGNMEPWFDLQTLGLGHFQLFRESSNTNLALVLETFFEVVIVINDLVPRFSHLLILSWLLFNLLFD